MTNLEIVLNMLAEATTTELSKKENPSGFEQSLDVAIKGGKAAGRARKEIEKTVGKSIVSNKNAKSPKALDETKESLLLEKDTKNSDNK